MAAMAAAFSSSQLMGPAVPMPLAPSAPIGPSMPSALDIWNTAGCGATGFTYQPRHRQDRHQVRKHGHELAGNGRADDGDDALQVVRKPEQERREEGSDRVPPAEIGRASCR